MKFFKFKAKDPKGNFITGEVEAPTEEAAAKLVHRQNLIIISLTPKSELGLNILAGFRERTTSGDLTVVTRQLATMIKAGLPITEALLILRTQTKGSMQKVIAQILADVEDGESLSSAMSKHTKVFSKTYIALIKSGESGGVLDEVLTHLASDLEKQQEFRGKIKSALIYPAIIVVGMVIVAFVMIVFVIPRLTIIYEQFDVELPITTKLIIALSNFMVSYWPLIMIGIGALVWGLNAYRKTEKGGKMVDDFIFRLPLIGELQRKIILADVTRTLSLMIASGVSIIEALTLTSDIVKNSLIRKSLEDVKSMVEKGFPLAFAFSRHPDAFPFILSQMIAVGEETGKMDEVLAKISHIFEVESDQKLKAITAAVEPVILIVLGFGVAVLVVSIILPIYNLTTQI